VTNLTTRRVCLRIDSVFTGVIHLFHKDGEAPRKKESEMALKAQSKKIDGVTVTICLTEDEGLCIEDGGKWLLMCEDHGSILQDSSYRRLWANADEVSDWCEECRINDRVTVA
jgi:hypothetical protein